MDTFNPFLFFPTARQFDHLSGPPSLMVDETVGPTVKVLRPGTKVVNVLAVGSGAQLAGSCGRLLTQYRELVLKVDLITWWRQLPEVYRILSGFLREAAWRPAMLWGHTVCWTDRAANRYFRQSHLQTVDADHRAFPFGSRVILRFENDYRRRVAVQTDAIQWLLPVTVGTPSVVKVVQQRRTLVNGTTVRARSHRETLGLALNTPEDEPWLVRSMYPGMKPLVYSVAKTALGGLTLGRPGLTGLAGRVNGNPGKPGRELIDGVGVLDVFILKAWRLFKRAVSEREQQILRDELSFAFDRSGRVAYIAATFDTFEGWESGGYKDRHFIEWYGRHRPSSKGG